VLEPMFSLRRARTPEGAPRTRGDRSCPRAVLRRRRLRAALVALALVVTAVPVADRLMPDSVADALPAPEVANGQVFRLYRAALDREPDPGGFQHWVNARYHGLSLHAVAAAFLASPEFQQRFGAADDTRFVDLLYQNVLRRGPDPAGRAYWIEQVRRHGRTTVLMGFSESPEFQARAGAVRNPVPPPAPAAVAVPASAGRVLLAVDFNSVPRRDFGSVTRQEMGRIFGRDTSCSAPGELALGNGVLRVRLRPNSEGSRRSFCTVSLPGGHDQLWLRYRVAPENGWVPVKGGKLAGLAGGAANTGGNAPRSGEGFSARNMWRPGGALVQYTYHQRQAGRFGEDFRYEGVSLQPGQWRTVVHQVQLNTPGQANGSIRAWVDGRPVMARNGLVLRGAGRNFSIDKLMVGAFYGGADPSWAPPRTTYLQFDDIVVSTGPLN
jgi:hypothetical protein